MVDGWSRLGDDCKPPGDEYQYGDVSGSGTVEILDSMLVHNYLAGSTTLTSAQLLRADVDGDGAVTNNDATLIAQYATGIITSFPVCTLETCPKPIVNFTRFPEIWFEGNRAYCEVKINAGSGNTIDQGLSTIELYNGDGWVDTRETMVQIDTSRQLQTVILEWLMQKPTTMAVCNIQITNSCGESTNWVNSDYYEYPTTTTPVPCPSPTAGFTGTPKIWFEGKKANCRVAIYVGEGHTVDMENSDFSVFNGSNSISLKNKINPELSTQTILATWDMVADTNRCYANIFVRNDCGEFASVNTGYHVYKENITPPPPETDGDPITTPIQRSLESGSYDIEISKALFKTVKANITVTEGGVTCNTMDGVSPCSTTGYPRIETAGSSVLVYMVADEPSGGDGYEAWLAGKGGLSGITLSDIFELKDEFIGLTDDLDFTPTLTQIMECKDAFIGLI